MLATHQVVAAVCGVTIDSDALFATHSPLHVDLRGIAEAGKRRVLQMPLEIDALLAGGGAELKHKVHECIDACCCLVEARFCSLLEQGDVDQAWLCWSRAVEEG
eukprot:13065881-Alexandrium_andersonii.AAC.1